MPRFIIFTILALGTIVGALLIEGGQILMLVMLTPFLVTFFVPVISALAVWGFKGFGGALRSPFAEEGKAGSGPVQVWDFYEKTCYAAGILGLLIGLTLVLTALGKNNPLEIGRPLAACLMSILYCLVFGIIARILRARAEERS